MAEWVKVVLLGIVEGLTEFLPISSTGHLIIASSFLELRDSLSGIFEIFIQVGALVAVVGYYREDIAYQVKSVFKEPRTRHFWITVLVAFFPSAIFGLLLGRIISEFLFRPDIVAISLIVGGIVFIVIENIPYIRETNGRVLVDKLHDVTYAQALLIGLSQLLALVPGVSRSGASIIGGMISGLNREIATQFSFYLAIPTLGGATFYTLWINKEQINVSDAYLLFLGMSVSAVMAWLSIGWLLRYIAKNSFVPFGYYRIIVGIIILLLASQGVI